MPENKSINKELLARHEKAEKGGGEKAIERQHNAGKLLARERIDLLLDTESFFELDKFRTHDCTDFGMDKKVFLGDGVITGQGLVDNRPVYLFAQDFTVVGGSLSNVHAQKSAKSWIWLQQMVHQ